MKSHTQPLNVPPVTIVMRPAEEFRRWVSAPARTGEELYPVELLLNHLRGRAEYRKGPRSAKTLRAAQAGFTRRTRQPRFKPRIEAADLDLAEEFWDEILSLENGYGSDRPVRDLSLLRFLPQLTAVNLTLEGTALAALATLPRLARLTLKTGALADFSALGSLATLEWLSLTVACPWPTGFGALSKLSQLREVTFGGNLLVWQEVVALPAVRSLVLAPAFAANTPLPSLRVFPAAPELQTLTIGAVAELRGVQRFADLRELDLAGPFTDLHPLAALQHVRKLRLAGEQFLDLAPLARMRQLHSLELNRERGLAVDVLLDAPSLREVSAPRCKVLTKELGDLNAALGWVDKDLFVRENPRPLAPLRLLACEYQRDDYASLPPAAAPPTEGVEDRATVFGEDPAPPRREQLWMKTQLHSAVSAVLRQGWGHVNVYPTSAMVVLRRPCDMARLPLVVQAVREVLARSRFAWACLFDYDPDKTMDDPEAAQPRDAEQFDAARAKEEWEDARRRVAERQEAIEREYRALRGLDTTESEQISPDEPGDDQETSEADLRSEPLDLEEATSFSPDAFNSTPAGAFSDGGEEVDEDLDMIPYALGLEEPFLWVRADSAELASRHMQQPAEDWHSLPEPPERRPRRRTF
ncbi:MAG TPA: hypothetical protein VK178_13535 [Opitutaceae bacterium]|nr:hypothetical protein [Opitutaceae bacterium]